MKLILNFFILLLITSCSSEQFRLNQYQKYPVKFARKIVTYPDKTFSLHLPLDWEWKVENFNEVEEITIGIDAFSMQDEKNFINVISIQKGKGFSSKKNLNSEYNFILEKIKQDSSLKLIEFGNTNFIKDEAYFVHTRSNSGIYGEIEMISFIIKSKSDNHFYYLNASAPRTEDLNKNMAIMIQCLKTFKEKN